MPNVRSAAMPSIRQPHRASPIAWWFGSAVLVAAACVLLFYVQLVHAAVERGALARMALPLPTTNGLAAADAVDPFAPESRRPALRTVRAVRTTPAAPAHGDRRVADSTL